ncbi:ABC transporter ATP-binding protein [Suttonella ornithocola]|uniref:Iron(3+)-hydroxamate import ATP-binding protein FhuC n=1 Tax=Suttonella ornithocola TaxID=279832 RepID=A0A380MPF9_9GAMM|nr:ATP-binding cassette domain-containing protein [Suttonella ornithocola]SUO93177.1 Iron(3+)-hydroxamate import ATP-binding protein FhuC [Suttonella ornithocola]
MIEIENLSYQINQHTILKPTTLSLPSRQLIALIGPNGAGKSTLLNHIARLIPIQSGRILIDGKDINTTPSRELAKQLTLFQQHTQLLSRLRIEELLLIARYPYHQGRPNQHDRHICEKNLQTFALTDIRKRFLDTLSGGQRQRALCAMAFAQDTPTILLDEPLNNLDMRYARELMQILRTAVDQHQKSILLVLHDINYAARYADYIVAMANGEIRHHGKTQDILTASNISALYQTPVTLIEGQSHPMCNFY